MQPQQNFSDFRVKLPSCYHPGNGLLITILLTGVQLQGAAPGVYFHLIKQERQAPPKPDQRHQGKACLQNTVQELEGDTQHPGLGLQPGSTSGHTRTSPEQRTVLVLARKSQQVAETLNVDQQHQRWQG